MANEKQGSAHLPDPSKMKFRLAKREDAKKVAEELLDARMEGDIPREQWCWEKFLNHTDPRLAFEAFRTLLAYKYGKPTEKKEVQVSDTRFTAEVPPKLSAEEWKKSYAPPPDPEA